MANRESFFTKAFIEFTVYIMSEICKKTHFPLTISLILNMTESVSFSISSTLFLYAVSYSSSISLILPFNTLYPFSSLAKNIFYLIRVRAISLGLFG